MLILWIKVGESIWVGETKVKVEKLTSGGKIRLAIDPEDDVFILRDQLKKPESLKASM